MYRLRGGVKENRSSLYTLHVLKSVSRSEAILDFGCGQGDYVRNLSKKGYRIFGLEFFYRDPKVNAIDAKHVHHMIDSVISHVRQYGLFDAVVCDAVLNSVDSVQAERDVLTCLNAFCRKDGRIFMSGRLIDHAERGVRARNSKNPKRRRVEFLDSNGLTGIYRYGGWFFQKFHSPHQAKILAAQYFGDEAPIMTTTSTCWQITARKQYDIPMQDCEAALSREFSLPWPGGRTVGRSKEVIATWRDCKAREAA
jgi:ParB family chromosome partitioning protein